MRMHKQRVARVEERMQNRRQVSRSRDAIPIVYHIISEIGSVRMPYYHLLALARGNSGSGTYSPRSDANDEWVYVREYLVDALGALKEAQGDSKIDVQVWSNYYTRFLRIPSIYFVFFFCIDSDSGGCKIIGSDGRSICDCSIEGTPNYPSSSVFIKPRRVRSSSMKIETGGQFWPFESVYMSARFEASKRTYILEQEVYFSPVSVS